MISRTVLAGSLVAAAGALALAGCGGTPAPVVGVIAPQVDEAAGQSAFAAADEADYRLRPTDLVSVTVYREPDLSLQNVPIASDGTVAVPLVGTVRAAGLTSGDLSRAIADALGRGYLVNPEVAVNVMKFESHRVSVEGAVRTPGVYPFNPGARLSTAIALAQGLDRVAKQDQIVVFRPTPEGMTVAKFDYRAMQQGTMIDPRLQAGDRVVVGVSGLSQAWQDALKTLPAFALFTQI